MARQKSLASPGLPRRIESSLWPPTQSAWVRRPFGRVDPGRNHWSTKVVDRRTLLSGTEDDGPIGTEDDGPMKDERELSEVPAVNGDLELK
jgi:hypothetical protein